MLKLLHGTKREWSPTYTVHEFVGHNCDALMDEYETTHEVYDNDGELKGNYTETTEYQSREQEYATNIMIELYEDMLYDNKLHEDIIADDIAHEGVRERMHAMD